MNYHFHPSALTEFNNAINYYQSLNSSLGLEFAEEIYSTIQRILQFPSAWNPISGNCRRCLTKRFPYAIIYSISNNEIYIIALMQRNQKPGYWKDRVELGE